jgi:psp operon transcriptional activator
VHYLSPRWDATFLKMNCAAISENLLESELFGHEAGAFTGATRAHPGRFERAHGGTLFLDELGTTSPLVQEKILRVIEYGEFERLGGSKTITVDVRIVAATNDDLPALAASGRFRADLLDRLAFDVITLPPLRARREDIPLLAHQFAMGMARSLGREYFPGFAEHARQQLLDYAWPGNVRELKNVVERSVYRSTDVERPIERLIIDPFDSPHRPTPLPRVSPAGNADAANGSAEARPATEGGDPAFPLDLKGAVADFEQRQLRRALEAAQFNQRKAAPLLGLSYDQLRGYLRKYRMVGDGQDEQA